MERLIFVALGGAIGSPLRYLTSGVAAAWLGGLALSFLGIAVGPLLLHIGT